MSLASGTRLGPYEILAPIGAGGMGEVWKARDTRLGRIVAIKVSKDQFTQRFEREARSIAALNHPNICTLHDIGPNYLVMEFIEGAPIGPIDDPRELIDVAVQVADGLAAAHAGNIIHRDLKPGNIVRTRAGRVKILDFGLATTQHPMEDGATLAGVTVPGTAIGTVAYMSPEQARGRPLDARTDLWSLGVILYEIATGARPFEGATNAVVFEAILNKVPTPARERNPKVPAELEKIIAQLLEKDITRRYQTTAELCSDLKRLAGGSSSVAASILSRRSPLAKYGIAAAAVIALAGGGLFFWRRAQASPLTDKDVLVLADFANNTGDPIFNTTLREALAVQLEQSPFLKIMGDEQVRQDLKFMGRSSDEHITSQLAREICQREGDKARVDGTIAQLGKTYAITLEATNCQTGEPLAREQAQAADKDHVLQAISTAVSGMRRKLGESLASIQKLDRPLGQVTTTSLEAFQAYSLGLEQFLRGDYAASIPFFQRATELDPNFGAAWRHLGLSFGNSRRGTRRAEEGLTKAFTLRDRASERERLASLGSYYRLTRDLAKATDASELWARTYPRDAEPHVNLGHLHEFMGQLEEASKEYEEAYRLEPWVTVVANRLMNSYVNLSRLEDAKAVADKTFARHVDPAEIHQQFLWIAFVQENLADAAREIHWFVDKPEEGVSLVFQALNAATHGQLHSAREVFKRSIDVAKQRNLPAVVGMSLSNSQSMSVIGSNCPAMRSLGGAAAMLCSDADASLKAAEDEAKQYPSDPTVNAIQLPTLRAAVELKRDNAAKAVESLQLVAPYERANASAIIYRGLAYLLLHREVEAGAEFQKILDNPGNYWGGPEYLLAYLGRARAAALSGDTAKSKKVYQEFFALWKDADQDIPLLLEARKEYAALK